MSAPDKHGKPHHRWNASGDVWRCGDCPAEFRPGTPMLYRSAPDGEWVRERPSCTRTVASSPWSGRRDSDQPSRFSRALGVVRGINRARAGRT